VTHQLLELLQKFGSYGGSVIVAFIAGFFPLFSIEAFLVVLAAKASPTPLELTLCCLLAATSHQIAKTICYYMGVGVLERGRIKAQLDKVRPKIEKWNKAPKLVMFLSASIGLPPLLLLAFIAEPIMRMRFWTFTVIVFAGRFGRFITLAVIPLLF
jgi:membrane protein YqaA with SNARE-associated domain